APNASACMPPGAAHALRRWNPSGRACASTSTALFVPAATPRAIIDRLDSATREALPHLRTRFAELGLEPFVAGPTDAAAYLREEVAKWTGVIWTARITAD
ncbi:hypothetical protein D9599_30380, partial [Roseomonas sp. KE2513]|nr:hypothetical protein [Roseomonas sp. KE2513]